MKRLFLPAALIIVFACLLSPRAEDPALHAKLDRLRVWHIGQIDPNLAYLVHATSLAQAGRMDRAATAKYLSAWIVPKPPRGALGRDTLTVNLIAALCIYDLGYLSGDQLSVHVDALRTPQPTALNAILDAIQRRSITPQEAIDFLIMLPRR